MPTETEIGSIDSARGQLYVQWKIKDYFSQATQKDEIWCSPKFHLADSTWYLTLHPNGNTKSDSGYISIFLYKAEPQTLVHRVTFTIGIKMNNGSLYNSHPYVFSFENKGCGFRKFIKRSDLVQDKAEDFVTFFCIICFPESYKTDATSQTSSRGDFDALSRDYKNLFLSKNGSDVTIKVKGEEFHAHSQILVARSSVFAPMLTHDMKERNTGAVDVEDCEPGAFREFLMFLYSGQAEKISSDNVADLYHVAEKYNAEELKTRCSDFMKDEMSVDTFCDVMSLALKYGDTELIDFAKEYFIKNVKKVLVTVKWISFVKNFPIESTELTIKAVNNLSPD